jgi:hypothetical protein
MPGFESTSPYKSILIYSLLGAIVLFGIAYIISLSIGN